MLDGAVDLIMVCSLMGNMIGVKYPGLICTTPMSVIQSLANKLGPIHRI